MLNKCLLEWQCDRGRQGERWGSRETAKTESDKDPRGGGRWGQMQRETHTPTNAPTPLPLGAHRPSPTLLSLAFWSSKSSRSSSNFFSFASVVTFSSCSFCRAPSSASRWVSSSWRREAGWVVRIQGLGAGVEETVYRLRGLLTQTDPHSG